MAKRMLLVVLLALLMLGASACSQRPDGMQDGYYTAEMEAYDANGWKEFITIYVSNDRIVTAEYDAKKKSGFLKSWDNNYMRAMSATDGVYPSLYARVFVNGLLTKQSADEVDMVSGATHSHSVFKRLAAAAIEQAKAGDKTVALVDYVDVATSATGW